MDNPDQKKPSETNSDSYRKKVNSRNQSIGLVAEKDR